MSAVTAYVAAAALLGSAVIGGVFFAFSSFVMKALARVPASAGIGAMQSINVAVLNPWFLAAFFGTAAVCALLAVLAVLDWSRPGAITLLSGALLYLLGCIGVTLGFNVPLNKKLAAVEPNSAEGRELWRRYLSAWTAWNHVRTLASLAAAASFIIALRS